MSLHATSASSDEEPSATLTISASSGLGTSTLKESIVLSGPAGAGKDTIGKIVLAMFPGIVRPVTATTRPMRAGEVDGVSYIFLARECFEEYIKQDYFVEYAEVHGNLYGTPTETFMAAWSKAHVWLQVDVQGAKQVKSKYPQTHLIYIDAPRDSLERRMVIRGDKADDIVRRLATRDWEDTQKGLFGQVIMNADEDNLLPPANALAGAVSQLTNLVPIFTPEQVIQQQSAPPRA